MWATNFGSSRGTIIISATSIPALFVAFYEDPPCGLMELGFDEAIAHDDYRDPLPSFDDVDDDSKVRATSCHHCVCHCLFEKFSLEWSSRCFLLATRRMLMIQRSHFVRILRYYLLSLM